MQPWYGCCGTHCKRPCDHPHSNPHRVWCCPVALIRPLTMEESFSQYLWRRIWRPTTRLLLHKAGAHFRREYLGTEQDSRWGYNSIQGYASFAFWNAVAFGIKFYCRSQEITAISGCQTQSSSSILKGKLRPASSFAMLSSGVRSLSASPKQASMTDAADAAQSLSCSCRRSGMRARDLKYDIRSGQQPESLP